LLLVAAATAAAVGGLLAAELRGARAWIWIAKPLASLGFVSAALVSGALATAYGQTVLVALVLSFVGDVLLIPRGARLSFALGLTAFLLAHVAYAVAFALSGVSALVTPVAVAGLLIAALALLRWLGPHLPASLVWPVRAYVLVISAMVVCAVARVPLAADWRVPLGALAFAVSDVFVARERFVASGFVNKAWGLPLYYGSQLLLASTVAT
jgi:uncharacterized membrane protein YhhN